MLAFDVKKYLIPSALLAAVTLTACDKAPQQQFGALPVDVYVVKSENVPVISHLTGRATPTRKAEVRPQVSGILQKRLFKEGSIVQQGEQLYQIDPSVYEANVKSAEAALASAKANLHTNKLRAERYRHLLDQKAVSKQDYDDAQANYLTAKANVEAAQATLKKANIDLGYTKVYAPITGTINRSNVTEGALVSVGQQTALTTIQQLDPIYVDLGETAEEHIALRKNLTEGKLLNDGKASVEIHFTDGSLYNHKGVIEFAEVSVDETTGMVNLRAIVPNPDNVILPGIFLRGDINQGILPNATVVVANGAQREPNGITFAYVINDKGLVERRDIKLGSEYKNGFVVTSGLNVGDKVIVSNIQKIRPGMPVTAIDPNAASQQAPAQK
ncbi:MAG: efflux RND transporter periplasmic adaptor subunit [Aeromonadales bacterium]|nr:efflux RND transporter periplasmic adaptor subunit [Aeromonadales bacterium]